MSTQNNPSTAIGIAVSAEMASKLDMAFYGLPEQRQETVYENAKKVGRNQAIFDEIFSQKLEHYYEKGIEKRDEIFRKQIEASVHASGKSWNAVCEFLNLKQYMKTDQPVAVNPTK